MDWTRARKQGGITIRRWPTEVPLTALAAVVGLWVWLFLAGTIVGLLYAGGFALFIAILEVIALARIRGSGVKLGPHQLPDLYEAVSGLSRRLGLPEPPETYVMHAGGSLDSLVKRLARFHILVLSTDLLEACGTDVAARDMIIGHELGHIRAGHMRFRWLLAPAMFVPFLGTAVSRAREYTCDRYGRVAAGDEQGALKGLAVLAAGPVFGSRISLRSFVQQQRDLAGGLPTLGEWLSSRPALSRRISALAPSLAGDLGRTRAPVRAIGIAASLALSVWAVSIWAFVSLPELLDDRAADRPAHVRDVADVFVPPDAAGGAARVAADFGRLSRFIDEEWHDTLPAEGMASIVERWTDQKPLEILPIDPFEGVLYGFDVLESGYRLRSSGPDGTARTEDDIEYIRQRNDSEKR